MKVLLHVNYHEGKGVEKLRELFGIAAKFGYDGVELRWKYRWDDMSQTEYQNLVAGLKNEYPQMEIVFGGNVQFCRGSRATVERECIEYLDFLEWASKECGTRLMNFFTGALIPEGVDTCNFHAHGSAMASEDDYRRSAEGLRLLGNRAEKYGIRIALETHNNYLHDLPKACKKLLDMTECNAVGINYDHGNVIINKFGGPISEVFELLPDKIYYAHLKNILLPANTFNWICTRLDEGHINNMELMGYLKKYLKGGVIATEYPNPGDGIIAAKKDMDYIKFLKDYLDIQ